MRTVGLSLAAAALVVSLEGSAHACSWVLSCESFATAPNGSSLPVTAPGLVIDTSGESFSSTSMRATVTTAAGATVSSVLEAESDYSFVRFLAPLAAGASYRLRVENDCDQSGSIETASRTIEFTATTAQPLPSAAGTATVQLSTVNGLRIAKLLIAPSAELAPFLAVTRFRTVVDGQPWEKSDFGAGPAQPFPVPQLDSGYYGRVFTHLYAQCDGSTAVDSCSGATLTPKVHAVQIFADVAGTAPLVPIELDVDLACETNESDAGALGGVAPEGPSSPASPSAPRGPRTPPAADETTAATTATAPACGCVVAGWRGASAKPGFALLLGGALLLRRWSRSKRKRFAAGS